MSSLPYGATVTAVQLGICYSDDNAVDDGFQTITPWVIQAAVTTQLTGTPINPKGSMAKTVYSQTFDVADFESRGISLEVGVTDHGFLASSRVRVYSMWATLLYDLPPASQMTLTDSVTGYLGSVSPFGVGQSFDWAAMLTVTGSAWYGYDFTATWDPQVLFVDGQGWWQSSAFPDCQETASSITCHNSYPGYYGSGGVGIRMKVASASPCSATISASLHMHGDLVSSVTRIVPLNGGCAALTATSTPTPPTNAATTSGSTQTATATSQPPATATPSQAATSTPLPTSAATSTPVPSATPSASPTVPPGTNLKFRLRAAYLARD